MATIMHNDGVVDKFTNWWCCSTTEQVSATHLCDPGTVCHYGRATCFAILIYIHVFKDGQSSMMLVSENGHEEVVRGYLVISRCLI